MMILLMSRASDTVFRASEARGLVKSLVYGNVLLWVVTNTNQQYFWGNEKDLVNKGTWKFMAKWSMCSPNYHEMIVVMNKVINDRIVRGSNIQLKLR
mmetsp:Transcript_7497/g.11687  ORF Transcript_7497/g.11687 Transcript_7497/m.11687 type:complete len:97 (-) Transcript_7497:17-307(-)